MSQAWDDEGQQALSSAEPQEFLHRRLRECPVQQNADGSFTVLRMADVQALNLNKQVLGVSHPSARGVMGGDRPLIPLELDGPDHAKYRRVLDPLFSLKHISWIEQPVRQLSDELIDTFIDAGGVDVYGQWCQPLPSRIFMRLMGVPEDDLEFFLSFKNRILGHGYTLEERMANLPGATRDLYEYFNAVLDRREGASQAGHDMIGRLMSAESGGQGLSREEILDIIFLMMIAGLDTVAASLACILVWLAEHPDARRRLVSEPSLWPSAVEELMRFESPVHQGYRHPVVDIEIDGQRVPADSTIHVSWAAANLDPDVFDEPVDVKLDRSPNPHIAFASGYHRCLGSHLARLELRVALEQFHQRIPDYALAEGAELVFDGNPRAPHALPLVWR